MSAELLSSKVVIVEEEPRVRGIPSAPTSVAGAVGITQRGPVGEAVLCSSFEDYLARFGGFTPDSDLALAAMGFFENGGSALWAVRTVHYEDPTDPSSATATRAVGFITAGAVAPTPAEIIAAQTLPVPADDGDTLVVSINGGVPLTASIVATRPSLTSTGVFPTGFVGGETLSFVGPLGPDTVTFSAADQDADAVAQRLNAALKGVSAVVDATGQITLRADVGGYAVTLQVTGGSANDVLHFPPAAFGAGNVANSAAVTMQELAQLASGLPGLVTLVDADGRLVLRTALAGSEASLQVLPGSTLTGRLGFDNLVHTGAGATPADAVRVEGKDPGAYGNLIEIEIRTPTSGGSTTFDLAVIEDGVYRETFPDISLDPAAARYVETIVNDARSGSRLVRVADQHVALPLTPDLQVVSLVGGDDGLAGLTDTDFIGAEAGKTGLYALDRVLDLSLLLVPGRATPAVHNAMVRYCELDRDGAVFAILDPPEGLGAQGIVAYVETTAVLLGLTEHAAIYWPRVRVLNPARSVFGTAVQITVPPSGIIAGVFTRTDAARPGGIYDPPAGIDKGRMFGVLGFETDEVLEERKRDLVYPKRINPLTTGPGLPRYIDGSRTLQGDGNFPYVAERRGVSYIEKSLRSGLQFARHRNNTEALRAQVRRTITAFLLTQMNNGAFRSREPSKAFFVDVSDALNTPDVIFAGKLIARVGLATNKPAEFILVRIAQDTREIDALLAQAGA